jgi:hypothetical protein
VCLANHATGKQLAGPQDHSTYKQTHTDMAQKLALLAFIFIVGTCGCLAQRTGRCSPTPRR